MSGFSAVGQRERERQRLTVKGGATYLPPKMGVLSKLCGAKELEPGQGRTFSVGGRSIALFNVDGEFHAIESECTHEGGPLGDGPLRGTRVLCPWHGAEFDVTTGAALSAPAYHAVSSFRVVVEAGDVKVELP